MTCVDTIDFPQEPLVPGRAAYDRINQFFVALGQPGGAEYLSIEGQNTSSRRSPLEDRLRYFQDTISEISMHLPKGFAAGLSRQFANLMDEDAWEDDDELVSRDALNAFLLTLLHTRTVQRPGIGTNGRGSVTAAWTQDGNRLTIECLPTGLTSLVLSRLGEDGTFERAAFDQIRPKRIRDVLAPFDPGVWFDH